MHLFELKVSLDICPGVVLLGLMATLFLIFWGTSILFSIVAAPISIPFNSVGSSLFPTSSLAFVICRLSSDRHSDQCELYFIVVLICISLIITLATSCKELTHWKRLWCWEGLGAGGEGDDRGWDGWMASLTRWTWVSVNSGSWWWTGRPGVLRFMGLQRVGHDWATELNWTDTRHSGQKFSEIIGLIIFQNFDRCHFLFHLLFPNYKTKDWIK